MPDDDEIVLEDECKKISGWPASGLDDTYLS